MTALDVAVLMVLIFCFLAGIMDIVKARRKNQKIRYFFSGFFFLAVVAFVALFFGQVLLSLVVFGMLGILGFFLFPKTFGLHKQEVIIQKQGTDISDPLTVRDFLNWKAWIKLKAIYGFRKMMIIYIVLTTTIVVAILFVFIVLGIIPAGTQMYYVIMGASIPVAVNYYQSWKILKHS